MAPLFLDGLKDINNAKTVTQPFSSIPLQLEITKDLSTYSKERALRFILVTVGITLSQLYFGI